jgi:hypothetical protein
VSKQIDFGECTCSSPDFSKSLEDCLKECPCSLHFLRIQCPAIHPKAEKRHIALVILLLSPLFVDTGTSDSAHLKVRGNALPINIRNIIRRHFHARCLTSAGNGISQPNQLHQQTITL